MKDTYIMDAVQLYYVDNILKPNNQTGVRFTPEYRRVIAAERALDRFWCRMQIIILKLLLKRGRRANNASK